MFPPKLERARSTTLPVVVAAAWIVLALAVNLGPPQGVSVGGVARPFHTVATVTTPSCADLNSNASLNGTVASIYRGLPNISQTWSPISNTTMPANESAYPNETEADLELDEAWTSICDSSTYRGLLARWGSQNVTEGFELNGSTGHYQLNFGIYWHAPCSRPYTGSNGDCQDATTWYFDLATGSLEGPFTTESGGAPLGWGPPPPPTNPETPSDGGSGGAAFGLPTGQGDAVLAILVGAAAIGVALAALLGRRPKTPKGSGPSTPR